MNVSWRGDRRAGRRAAGVALGALALVAAGCGSSGSSSGSAPPAGLTGTTTAAAVGAPATAGSGSVQATGQNTKEDRQAASVLTPARGSFLYGKHTITLLGSTTPSNGDVNPYAIWPVNETIGSVRAGDVLVDNFNNASNDQGTGTTIVDVHAGGRVGVFAHLPRTIRGCPGGVGLTTAMVQLKSGWVIVGSLPSRNGKTPTAGAGCLIVLAPTGRLAGTIAGPEIDGPWDAAVSERGRTATLFVTNVLFGIHGAGLTPVHRGDVERLTLSDSRTAAPKVLAQKRIATGFPERGDAAAFVKGPTGVALGRGGTLYVADTLDDRITQISHALTRNSSAGTGTTLTIGGQLANPLGIVVAPDGDILAANSTNGKIVEVTPSGHQVGAFYAIHDVGQDPPGNGDLFDLVISDGGHGILFVKDDTNTLALLH